MGFRSVFIQSPAQLSLRQGQLVIQTDLPRTLPLEDLDCLLLESTRSTVTVAALAACADAGVTVLVCNAQHIPCAVLTAWNAHSRQYAVLKDQLSLSLPAKKRLWQQLVQAKIANQAACLVACGKQQAAETLQAKVQAVLSGDSSHQEGAAAALHFTALFGPDFTRAEDCVTNAALNYGYAILRGQLARLLAGHGFTPALGLNHCSELNAFNLADDLIEPYRPLVDLFVATQIDPELSSNLSPALKAQLLQLLHREVWLEDKRQSVANAMEHTVQSLRRACQQRGATLQLPRLADLTLHQYE